MAANVGHLGSEHSSSMHNDVEAQKQQQQQPGDARSAWSRYWLPVLLALAVSLVLLGYGLFSGLLGQHQVDYYRVVTTTT